MMGVLGGRPGGAALAGLGVNPPARLLAAADEVQIGRSVTLASPLAGSAADNPEPGARHMKHLPGESSDVAGLSFAADQLAINVHGDVDSHIDALCHVSYQGALYNGVAPGAVTSQGASVLSIDDARDGIAGRGVLLDIPALRGVRWLEPGDCVTAADLAAAQQAQQVRVGPGDLLFVRVGHRLRREELGPWDAARSRAGLHPQAMEYLAERRVAALGSDGNSDTAPSAVDGVAFPVHGGRPLVLHVRHRAAPAARRNRLPSQPDCHLVRSGRGTQRQAGSDAPVNAEAERRVLGGPGGASV